MDVNHLVFIDESSVNTGMTRHYGRGLSGERVVDHTPDVRSERTTILSSVRASGELVPCVFEGSLNGEILVLCIYALWVRSTRYSKNTSMSFLCPH